MQPSVADMAHDDAGPAEPTLGSRRFGLATLAIAVVAALLAGFAIGVLALRPAAAPADDSPEAGFARDMITHHDQAVEMGMIAYTEAELPGVRQIAYDIATNQQGEIGMMHQWLREWELGPTAAEPPMAWMPDGDAMGGAPMPGMASRDQMAELREAEGIAVDQLFLELMIDHHLGGIHMIDGVLELTDHSEVVWLAELMKSGQQHELEVLRNLQQQAADHSG
ncbi:DUF305 domain-containing protein [Natronosporangium hydrolyticum]|uniref:DUF305 domain-containing protein n=1 Tax=Natronosporangium hydrolyticum TaxID=2811111 RepID=A0A895YDF6_9ACTN|nr:DUF305 domain-containing protein [Natronosporangium hydrolyticum]QSB15834.1 DUF305 domain-containing protein [Natronosporangium hydrolyticum]